METCAKLMAFVSKVVRVVGFAVVVYSIGGCVAFVATESRWQTETVKRGHAEFDQDGKWQWKQADDGKAVE